MVNTSFLMKDMGGIHKSWSYFSLDEIERYLTDAGFDIISIEIENYKKSHSDLSSKSGIY
jgi:hypothetical protein